MAYFESGKPVVAEGLSKLVINLDEIKKVIRDHKADGKNNVVKDPKRSEL